MFLSDILLLQRTLGAASQVRSANNSIILRRICSTRNAMRPLLTTQARHSQSPRTPTSAHSLRAAAASLFQQGSPGRVSCLKPKASSADPGSSWVMHKRAHKLSNGVAAQHPATPQPAPFFLPPPILRPSIHQPSNIFLFTGHSTTATFTPTTLFLPL
jgi:hypothetical protein